MVSVEDFGHGVYFYEIATNTRMSFDEYIWCISTNFTLSFFL